MMTLFSLRAAAALTVIVASLAMPVAAQTAAPVQVQWMRSSPRNFTVHVLSDNGTTERQAELMARERACEVARERGYTHVAVNEFHSGLETRRVVTREAQDAWRIADGQARVIGRDAAQYGTATRGTAVLMATLANAGAADMLRHTMDFLQVDGCRIIPKVPR